MHPKKRRQGELLNRPTALPTGVFWILSVRLTELSPSSTSAYFLFFEIMFIQYTHHRILDFRCLKQSNFT